MATQPALGITDPYQLNEAQFAASIALLEKQRDEGDPLYWSVYTDQIASYAAGDVDDRHDVAAPGRARSRPTACPWRGSSPTRARPAGPTPG